MPLQNHVSPSGETFASTARGSFMGNRGGVMHNERREIVRQYAGRRWITCLLEFKGRRNLCPLLDTRLSKSLAGGNEKVLA